MANTAKILEHTPGQPYTPRQIGAGLIQTQDAITTQVFATVDGEPHIALRQIDGPRTFTITNRGDRDHTSTTGNTCVIAEKQVAKEANTTSCNTAAENLTAATNQVTVPAGGTTLDLELSATDSARNTTRRTISVTLVKTPPQVPGQPGQPGVPQKPSKPTPPITRTGLPRTGG